MTPGVRGRGMLPASSGPHATARMAHSSCETPPACVRRNLPPTSPSTNRPAASDGSNGCPCKTLSLPANAASADVISQQVPAPVREPSDPFDLNNHLIAVGQEPRRLSEGADAWRGAGGDDVAGL